MGPGCGFVPIGALERKRAHGPSVEALARGPRRRSFVGASTKPHALLPKLTQGLSCRCFEEVALFFVQFPTAFPPGVLRLRCWGMADGARSERGSSEPCRRFFRKKATLRLDSTPLDDYE